MATAERKRIWGWMAFDWASQPFYTLGLTFIFGPYFAVVATEYFFSTGMSESAADARAQWVWSAGQTVAGLLIALTMLTSAFAALTILPLIFVTARPKTFAGGPDATQRAVPQERNAA